MKLNIRRNPRNGRRPGLRGGNAVLETALVLPVLLYLAFGTVEFGHYFFVKHTLQGAAREGARRAIVSGAANSDVNTSVQNAMSAAGFSTSVYTVTTSPTTISSAASGVNVSVTVSCNWGTVGVRPLGLMSTSKTVTAVAVMRKE